MDHIQPYLDYFTANPGWAIVAIFLIAFGEALLIIGLFVPSTVVLVGAGTLVGTGHLPFWPVFLATVIGAIAGDQISYWAGRLYGDSLKLMWPLSRFPALVAKGEDFVSNHGGKSIAVGRFVPGVKAVVPGIVGMLGMNQPFFIFVNVTSGIIWAAAHVFPGILVGQGLALAGEFSGRLTILFVLLLVILGVLGWVTRLLAAGLLSPLFRRALADLSQLVKTRRTRPFQRLGRAMAPENPRAARILSFGLAMILAATVVAYLLYRVVTLETASNLDQSLHGILQDLRSQPGDTVMTAITMLGDWQVLFVVCATMVAWLVWHRAWRSALALVLALAAQQIFNFVLKTEVGRLRPSLLPDGAVEGLYSFPSGHAASTTLVFGLLAVVAGHAMGRWSRAVLVSSAAMVVCLVAFSRLYLGVHWLGDVLAGIAVAAAIVAVFGVVLEAYPARRIRPLGLVFVAVVAWLVSGWIHMGAGIEKRLESYAPNKSVQTYSMADWPTLAWTREPTRRVDLSGQTGEPFVAQWVGPLDQLEAAATARRFSTVPVWSWQEGLRYSDPKSRFEDVPPRPLLHEGLKAKLTAVNYDAAIPDTRLVLRAFKSASVVGTAPVYLISLLRETHAPRFALYNLPRSSVLPPAEARGIMADLPARILNSSDAQHVPVLAPLP